MSNMSRTSRDFRFHRRRNGRPRFDDERLLGLPDPAFLEMSLGQVVGRPEPSTVGRAAILEFFTFPAGRVRAIEGLDEARALEGVLDLGLTFAVGDTLAPPADDRSRHMHVIAAGSSTAEAAALVSEVERLITVHFE